MKYLLINLFLVVSYPLVYGLKTIWLFERPTNVTFTEYINNKWEDKQKNSPYLTKPIKTFIKEGW